MLGDIIDAKREIAAVLNSQPFLDALAAVVAEKRIKRFDTPDPCALRSPTVYENEVMSRQLFPMCELLAFGSGYADDTMVKQATHRIGMRWTVLEKNEENATLSAELLCAACVELFWNQYGAGYLAGHPELNASSVNILEEDYSPLFPNPDGAFVKGGVVIVELTTYRS